MVGSEDGGAPCGAEEVGEPFEGVGGCYALGGDGDAGDGETIFCVEDTECYEGAGVCTAGAGCGSFGGAGYPVECYYVVAAEVDGC